MITINVDKQILIHSKKIYSISTAKKGVGEIYGSNCTPRGKFIISEKYINVNTIKKKIKK